VQLVHTKLDWVGSLGWNDRADIDVSTSRLGTTSFTLDFAIRAGERAVASARTVYVVVGTDGSGKQQVPQRLRTALGTA
jgi:acyl-CoA thioester hydrolase